MFVKELGGIMVDQLLHPFESCLISNIYVILVLFRHHNHFKCLSPPLFNVDVLGYQLGSVFFGALLLCWLLSHRSRSQYMVRSDDLLRQVAIYRIILNCV